MPITASDIVFRLSTASGSAGNTTAQGNPNASLGGYVSTTAWAGGTNSLFDNVSGSENAASAVDYRLVFVMNNHATITLENAVVYLQSEVSGGTNIAIAVDNIGPVAKGSSSLQSDTIANETTAPDGVGAFSSPTTLGAAIPIGSLAPGEIRGIWVRRTATASAAINADGFSLAVQGDTAA